MTTINTFASDNISSACPEVMDALAKANEANSPSYGEDPWTKDLATRLEEIFETPVTVFPVTTGTAANALALSTLTPAFGKIFCHELAHINTDECGAPEMFTGGAKLIDMSGANGRITAKALEDVIYGAGTCIMRSRPPSVSRRPVSLVLFIRSKRSRRLPRSRTPTGSACTWTVPVLPMPS